MRNTIYAIRHKLDHDVFWSQSYGFTDVDDGSHDLYRSPDQAVPEDGELIDYYTMEPVK
jgi:hypothetical protein